MTRLRRAPPSYAASVVPRPIRVFRALSSPGVRTFLVNRLNRPVVAPLLGFLLLRVSPSPAAGTDFRRSSSHALRCARSQGYPQVQATPAPRSFAPQARWHCLSRGRLPLARFLAAVLVAPVTRAQSGLSVDLEPQVASPLLGRPSLDCLARRPEWNNLTGLAMLRTVSRPFSDVSKGIRMTRACQPGTVRPRGFSPPRRVALPQPCGHARSAAAHGVLARRALSSGWARHAFPCVLHPLVRGALQSRTLRNTRSRAPQPPRHLSPSALVPRPWFQSP
jgi:hypothetical protein